MVRILLGMIIIVMFGCVQDNSQYPKYIYNGINEKGNFVISYFECPYTSMKTVITTPVTVIGSDESWNSYYVLEEGDTSPHYGEFAAGTTQTLNPYCIGRYEVTQKLYEEVMGKSQRKIIEKEEDVTDCGIGDNYPIYGISWYDAIAFCNTLSVLMGKTPCYNISGITNWAKYSYKIPNEHDNTWDAVTVDMSADGYRLPTEAEWEFAARGGDQNKPDWQYAFAGIQSNENINLYYNDNLDVVGWYQYNCSSVHPVGQKKSNRLGLYDMSGNVGEFCFKIYVYSFADKSFAVFRGGCFLLEPKDCVVSEYTVMYSEWRKVYNGFRIAQTITNQQ